MNQLPVVIYSKKLKINVTHMIYLIMQVMHYRELGKISSTNQRIRQNLDRIVKVKVIKRNYLMRL